jgi:hypothetical protein
MKKNKINENIFDSAKRFTDAFFDGLKNNAVDKMISKAEKTNVELPIIQKLKEIKQRKLELDELIKKYSKK